MVVWASISPMVLDHMGNSPFLYRAIDSTGFCIYSHAHLVAGSSELGYFKSLPSSLVNLFPNNLLPTGARLDKP